MSETNKPNGILMAEAIVDEARSAHRQKRIPRSSNAIRIFQKRTKRKLSETEAGGLFNIVFAEYCKLTGAHNLTYTTNSMCL